MGIVIRNSFNTIINSMINGHKIVYKRENGIRKLTIDKKTVPDEFLKTSNNSGIVNVSKNKCYIGDNEIIFEGKKIFVNGFEVGKNYSKKSSNRTNINIEETQEQIDSLRGEIGRIIKEYQPIIDNNWKQIFNNMSKEEERYYIASFRRLRETYNGEIPTSAKVERELYEKIWMIEQERNKKIGPLQEEIDKLENLIEYENNKKKAQVKKHIKTLRVAKKFLCSVGILFATFGLATSIASVVTAAQADDMEENFVSGYRAVMIEGTKDKNEVAHILNMSDKEVLEEARKSEDTHIQKELNDIEKKDQTNKNLTVAWTSALAGMTATAGGVVATKIKIDKNEREL